MIVGLRDCAPMSAMALLAQAIRGDDARGSLRLNRIEPSHQGGAKVETYVCVIVDNTLDQTVAVYDPRKCVGAITLGVDALVPVVERPRTFLAVDRAGPGVLARRLIKMTVYYYRGHGLSVNYPWEM